MISAEISSPIPLRHMARLARVPMAWLRAEAEAGRVPALRAGTQWFFDPPAVRAALRKRAMSPVRARKVVGNAR